MKLNQFIYTNRGETPDIDEEAIEMKKSYRFDGKTFNFSDVHMEAGCLYGRCTNLSHYDKWAWLDQNGFQFESERRVEAVEVPYCENAMVIPNGCHYWGGQIRNNAAWRKQW